MSTYKIKERTKKIAKLLNVNIKPSTNPKKKIDVFKDNKKVASIGQSSAMDYPTYLEKDPELAHKRRELYNKRHKNHLNKIGTPSWFASKLLWS